MSVTRRQHYVWRHYLSAWANQDMVATSRLLDKSFATNSINIAVVKDFYRMPRLSEEDVAFVNSYIDMLQVEVFLKEQCREWLRCFAGPERLRRLLSECSELTPEAEADIEKLEIEGEEKVHGAIEEDAVPILDALRTGSKDIWADEDDCLVFAIFLSFQHMRTKRMLDVVLTDVPPKLRDTMEQVFPVIRVISSTVLGWSLYNDRQNWRIRRLLAGGAVEFITSDQPTWNLLEPIGHNDLAIYYPVSPTTAILFENVNNQSVVQHGEILPDAEITRLNKIVVANSHEQIFGTDVDYLIELRRS